MTSPITPDLVMPPAMPARLRAGVLKRLLARGRWQRSAW